MNRRVSLVLLVISAAVGMAVLFVSGDMIVRAREWEKQELDRLFAEIFDRKIQQERIGAVGVQKFNTAQIDIPQNLYEYAGEVSCASKIVAKPTDPRKFFSTEVIVASVDPVLVVAFYYGEPPGISTRWLQEDAPRILGPTKRYMTDKQDAGEVYLDEGLANNDVRDLYRKYLAGKAFSVVSQVCDDFSFSVVRE